jgi:hypothetical protein
MSELRNETAAKRSIIWICHLVSPPKMTWGICMPNFINLPGTKKEILIYHRFHFMNFVEWDNRNHWDLKTWKCTPGWGDCNKICSIFFQAIFYLISNFKSHEWTSTRGLITVGQWLYRTWLGRPLGAAMSSHVWHWPRRGSWTQIGQ